MINSLLPISDMTAATTSSLGKVKTDGLTTKTDQDGTIHATETRELTQAQFDALPQEEKDNGTTYFISDGHGEGNVSELNDLTDVDITSASSGEVLEYDGSKWVNATAPSSVPSGGTTNQALLKNSNSDGDTKWADVAMPGDVTNLQNQINDLRDRLPQIYGAVWDGSADSEWTRTDDAATFSDPQPYYAGMVGTPSSPFDSIQPWAGMARSTDANAGEVVAIPKFYYKMGYASGTTGLKIQIAPASNGAEWAADNGFKVSPAHMDRGDGAGVRDVVYIGRYHCASDYKSKTGVTPKVSITRNAARQGIHALGSNIWQNDYATRVTLWMLYLVEFANWNSQNKIGGGCSATTATSSAVFNMGYTDSMPYHTGTVASSISRTVYGGTQYRNIEGLWDNCHDLCDGIYFSGADVYGILNPANFSDTTGGTLLGTRPTSTQYISKFSITSVSGFEWAIFPSAVAGSESTYVCDYYDYNADGVALRVGAQYSQNQNRGLFFLDSSLIASYSSATSGSRLMILP